MDKLFNSTFENSLRLLILLDEYDMPQTLDMLYVVDFMTVYSATFGITDQNLNGDNEYKFSVFASHREGVKEALKELVLDGTAQAVSYKEGLSYIITPEGEDFCESLDSDYAKEYRKNAQAVIKATANRSERTLISAVYKMSAKSFHEEVAQ
ncbi:hypothetical protein HMP0721_2436 [Pseudoramibacter alactolyticus ATCC 23263]|jgi:hypothetical protein|uniref:Uncharacterized protein n=1 Tax=Pseudoramibacter alactolyticus ATCC 23263 TaxID=887929 RepID=E6MKA0_9FIRM|nr:ABC-three component system middle component 2 [Pseudoramibacter alactolyticus]EFV00619.1 hypothetical protein HMP0721_2436 [Pseudoramibacter alactolyticus ATCC 23263]